MQFELPSALPVMTLPEVVFFPQALLPLHIFEARYREMLRDALRHNRLFAVAQLDRRPAAAKLRSEPPHRVATVGIIRACRKNENGTADLLLQGLCRIEIMRILQEEPYRRIAVRPLFSVAGGTEEELDFLREQTLRLLGLQRQLGVPQPEEMTKLIEHISDPEAFADLSAFALCESSRLKQRLLETLETKRRLQLIALDFQRQIRQAKLRRRLQGGLDDQHISHN